MKGQNKETHKGRQRSCEENDNDDMKKREKEEEAEWRKMLRSCRQDNNWKLSFRATGINLSLRNSTN